MGVTHRLSRLVKRVLLPLIALAYILFSVFNLHTRNIYNNRFGQLTPYTGGPIDDIKRIKCYIWYGPCNQIIEQKIDPENNHNVQEVVWHRVAKSLDLNGETPSSWKLYQEFLYVHYSENKRFNSPGRAITDIAIGDPNVTDPPFYVTKDSQSSGRPRSRLDITNSYNNWELTQDGIWVKYDKTNDANAITNIMYLFGEDPIEPRLDWSLVTGKLKFASKHPISLTVHRGDIELDTDIELPVLKESKKNEFKILQISDLHFSSDYGVCKDQIEKVAGCKADVKTLNFIHQVMDLETPDLVVITGDILDGSSTFDYQTAILKALSPLITRSIPYAIALGENDRSDSVSRTEIIEFIASLPFSMMKIIPPSSDLDTHDTTNYYLEIFENNGNALKDVIYILDLFNESQSNQATKFIKGTYDKFTTKPKLSLEFQYYPIKEFRPKGTFGIVGGYNERHRLSAKTDLETRRILSEVGVQAISVGYEHTNECCVHSDGKQQNLNSLWMCFGSSVGEGAYGNSKMDRRLRLFRLNSDKMEITSWKRRQGLPSEVFDYQFILQTS